MSDVSDEDAGEEEMKEIHDTRVITFRTFFGVFLRIIYALRSIIVTLLVFIILMGVLVAYVEGLSVSDGIYLAFVSALTVGYGDIVPKTALGRVICVGVLPILGMLITGIMVAAAVNAIDRGIKMESEKRKSK